VFEWAEPARNAIEQCRSFAAEYDLADTSRLNDHIARLPATELRTALGERAYQKANRMAALSLGMSLDHLPPAPPVFLLSILTRQLLQLTAGRNLDDELYQHAVAHELRTFGLESIERQLEILDQIDTDNQIRQLRSLLRNPARYRRRFRQTIDHYRRGAMRELYRSVKNSLGKERQHLLYDRNRRMARRFVELARGERLFAAVGAGHLWGGKGMLRFLKTTAQGRLTPLPKDFDPRTH
jgi:uncharacterized protein YbaP (TraB family)